MYILSQILATLADTFFAISMFVESKKKLLVGLILTDIFFGLHYFLLSAYTGMSILIIDIIYLISSYCLHKNNKENHLKYFFIIFVIATIFVTAFTWRGFSSIFPMIGMSTYFMCMGNKRFFVTKLGAGTRNFFNIIYLLCITSYLGATLEILQFICAIIGSINDYKIYKKIICNKNF